MLRVLPLFAWIATACQGHRTEPPPVTPRVNIPPAMALGASHTCAVLTDGTVRCFGSNRDQQLGVAGIASSPRPLAVSGVHGAIGVAAGAHHTCILAGDSTVVCWGANGAGQLGDGTRTGRATPLPVLGLAHVVQLAAGGDHTCARLADGTAACWGGNEWGELGLGDHATQLAPRPIPGLAGVQQIVAGATHTCALAANGEVRCWGDNRIGELGDGTRTSRATPGPIRNGAAIAIAAGDGHTCTIALDHAVLCWGDSSPNPAPPAPWIVPGLADAVQLAVGARGAYARTAAGAIVGWTNDWRYDPDAMSTLDRRGPPQLPVVTPVVGMAGATDVVAGSTHFCARLAGSDLRCWGDDELGQRGDGRATVATEPVVVAGLHDIAQLALGGEHSCARFPNGTMQCWGSGNEASQLGDGTTNNHVTPAIVPGLDHVIGISLGNYHTCALRDGGKLACWGNVAVFPLSTGSGVQGSAVPMPIDIVHPVVDVVAGGTRTCVRDASGAIACWDGGSRGPIPVPVKIRGVTSLAVAEHHACAVLADASVACWGDNSNGALGGGARTEHSTPSRVALGAATHVAVGFSHSCALLRDATVACWGANDFGQLGNGTTSLSLLPTPVPGLTTVIQLAAGGWTTCALLADGGVRCWGMNLVGSHRLIPVIIPKLPRAVEVAVGYAHACARLADGTARCWGTNRSGQLGDGTSLVFAVPTPVAW